jgi:hypothetical protein
MFIIVDAHIPIKPNSKRKTVSKYTSFGRAIRIQYMNSNLNGHVG